MTLGSSLSLSATTSPAVPPPAKETTEEHQGEEDPERTNVELTYDNIVEIEGGQLACEPDKYDLVPAHTFRHT